MINRAIPLLHVSNIAAAVEFYCSGLGFRLEYAHSPNDAEEDPCYLHLSRDGAWINLSSYSGDGVAGGVVNFMVDDVDTLHEEFLAKHVVIDTPPSPPVDQPWGRLREMHIKDADGNCLRFIE